MPRYGPMPTALRGRNDSLHHPATFAIFLTDARTRIVRHRSVGHDWRHAWQHRPGNTMSRSGNNEARNDRASFQFRWAWPGATTRAQPEIARRSLWYRRTAANHSSAASPRLAPR